MIQAPLHSFHIPVMGLGYTIDTPVKVARFGITSVVSIIEDDLVERMRELYYGKLGEKYVAIPKDEDNHRIDRVRDYLNLLKRIVDKQVEELRQLPFDKGSEIVKYFELLPDDSSLRILYKEMCSTEDINKKEKLQKELREGIVAGNIDVNIMSKLDRNNYNKEGEELPLGYSDAITAFRGFAESNLNSSMVFSAGYNPRLYAYVENYSDFFPDKNGNIKKKIVLKVSDFRSAIIQGKILAKKGIWVSEFRIESGLNCGGHAFPTEGYLLGPILEEFKVKKISLKDELLEICNKIWIEKGLIESDLHIDFFVSAQGGIGTANEDKFLRENYQLYSTGWGSPFLMVPEATNVDEETLLKLTVAKKEDYYTSHASPLGIPFNNFHNSSSELQRKKRIKNGRPGSPCYKKFLSSDTEFTAQPICTASREYQFLKIKQLQEKSLPPEKFKKEFDAIVEKDCLCEGLGAAVLIKNKLALSHKLSAVAICPGPNLAYFSQIFTLQEMVGHIYGRLNVLNLNNRPNIFINELYLYLNYFKKEITNCSDSITMNQNRYLQKFKKNLLEGIEYYKELLPSIKLETEKYLNVMKEELISIESSLINIAIPENV